MSNIKLGLMEDPETGEDLSSTETVLSGVGIKLRDSESEFRNFGDVLDEVASKWSGYSSVTKRAIAVAFSGLRQQEKFLVLMNHYNEAMEYSEVATTSAGVALDKYNNSYLKSTAAAQNRVIASSEALSTTVLNSDFVAGAFNAGAGFLGFLNNIISTIGIIPTLGGVVALVSLFKTAAEPKGGSNVVATA